MTIAEQTRLAIHSALASPGASTELISILNNLPSDELATALTAKVDEINARVHGQPATVAISNAAGTTNQTLISFQVKDGDGNNVTAPTNIVVTLSDAATGAGLTAVTASGTVAGTVGADLATLTSKKALHVQTNAAGLYTLGAVDSAKTLFYPTATIPGEKMTVGAVLTAGSYG